MVNKIGRLESKKRDDFKHWSLEEKECSAAKSLRELKGRES